MRKYRLRTLIRSAFLFSAVVMASTLVSGQSGTPTKGGAAWSTPRTAWGDPDLQGTYNSNDNAGVPVERPKSFGTRRELTDEEFAERQKQAERAARDDKADRRHMVEPFEIGVAIDFRSFVR